MAAAAIALFIPQLVFVPLMQHAMNRRTGARVWLLRQIGAGLIAGAPSDEARIDRVFRLDMRIFQLKFTMNFLMNLCSHLQIVSALLLGAWWVLRGQLEIGGIVAFIFGLGRLNDPLGRSGELFSRAQRHSRQVSTACGRHGWPGPSNLTTIAAPKHYSAPMTMPEAGSIQTT
jgi:ABC-type multidrug transport system fused ATPase/permease subunit